MQSHRLAVQRVVALAVETLSPAQARCFVLHLVEGWTETQIAAEYGCSQASVHQCLWGQGSTRAPPAVPGASRLDAVFKSSIPGSGAVARLSQAIKSDPVMQEAIAKAAGKAPEPPQPRVRDLSGWFAACRFRPEYFAAYATMILLDSIADASGRISVTELARQMPPGILSVVLPQLRAFGFIDNNIEPGVVRILKLPNGVDRGAPHIASTSLPSHVAGDELRSPEDSIIERLDAEAKEQA